MQEKFIIAKNRHQQMIVIDSQDLVGKGILAKGIYDDTGLYFIEKILSKLQSPLVFDIGANVGNHALRMGEYAQMVYLFEPQAQLVKYLQKTMALNNITNWKILSIGLSNENKKQSLYKDISGNNCTNSFVPSLKSEKFFIEETDVRIGDEVIAECSIKKLDFIKIDVEGFEAKVISGLEKSIKRYRPIIFMEWDKEITKQQFREYKLFERVFDNYIIRAVIRNPNERSLYKKICGRITRLFTKKPRKRVIIGEFLEHLDYRHVVLLPKEKVHVLENI